MEDNQYSHEVVYKRFKNMVGSIKQNCPSVTFNLIGSTVLYEIIEAATSDTPLNGHNTEIIEIRGYEMLNEQKEYNQNGTNDDLSQFSQDMAYAIPHNLEAMNEEFHNIVLGDI